MFTNVDVVVTVKMDGENTSLYSDGQMHARSVDGRYHQSRDWVKNFWSERYFLLPKHWRVCGENLFAKHSISYTDLDSFFVGFSVFDENNLCLSWEDTLEWFSVLGVTPVTTVYKGPFHERLISDMIKIINVDTQEGFVIRKSSSFSYDEFTGCIAKYVRKNHVTTSSHWMHQRVIPNQMKRM
jgi:hypothetical protein